MKIIRYSLLLLFCLATAAHAKPKEFKILGGKVISAEVEQGMPLPAEKDGIKIEAAAFKISDGKLIYTFGFTTKKKLKKVAVEDVSGMKAMVLVDDAAPILEKDYWKGDAKPLPLSRTGVPWIFESGATTRVFRFTITSEDQEQPAVLHQPAVYPDSSKKMLRKITK